MIKKISDEDFKTFWKEYSTKWVPEWSDAIRTRLCKFQTWCVLLKRQKLIWCVFLEVQLCTRIWIIYEFCLLDVDSIKLGVMEDHSNRTRLAKLLRFYSSNSDTEVTSLAEYIERMKEKQEHIYFIAGSTRAEVEKSPFVERLIKKGYEVSDLLFYLVAFSFVANVGGILLWRLRALIQKITFHHTHSEYWSDK